MSFYFHKMLTKANEASGKVLCGFRVYVTIIIVHFVFLVSRDNLICKLVEESKVCVPVAGCRVASLFTKSQSFTSARI